MKIIIMSLVTLFLAVILTAYADVKAFDNHENIIDTTIQKIELTPENFTDENIYKYHDVKLIKKMEILCNDQDKFTDPNVMPATSVMDASIWKPNFSNVFVGARGIIDLKKSYTITKIIAYDTNSNQIVKVESGSPFNWSFQTNLNLNSYTYFLQTDVNFSTRYLHLTCENNDSSLAEIVLYGYADGGESEEPYKQIPKEKPLTTIDKALGVNAFVDDPLNVSKVGGHIREFHNISFSYNSKNYFNPSANNAWDFDAYYKSLYDNGIDPVPCIQGTSVSISGDNIPDFSGNEKPIPQGANSLDPLSYKEHSSVMFNYAARYGNSQVAYDRLNLASNQRPLSGLGYIKYYENFNEPNKDWEGEKSYLSPYEMAAMCSADYDGHENRLGKNFGIKNADASSKLVMGGLVGRNVIEYIELMRLWFENNRTDKNFAVDVINLHYYIKTSAPENTSLIADLKAITDHVNKNMPGVEVWVTEFGPEISLEEIKDRYSEEYYEAKGFATVRMFLNGISAGVDRMTMFMLRDTDSGVYCTDGLVTSKGSWQTKPAWHYLYGTKMALKDTTFEKVITSSNEYIYKFKANNKDVYAMWLPSIKEETKEIYFDIGDKKSAQLTSLADLYAEGITSNVKPINGKVKIKLSARPVFLSLYNKENVKIAPTKKLLEIKDISGTVNTLSKIKVMFDEQHLAPVTPSARVKGSFENYNNNADYIASNPNVPENRLFPYEAVIDFGKEVTVTDVGFFDANNSGDIFVYALNKRGEWQLINGYGLLQYNVWVVNKSDHLISTRYVKILKYTDAVCYEMALYGY